MVSAKFDVNPFIICLSFFILLVSPIAVQGQEPIQSAAQKEVMTAAYEDVWKPFMESYRALDVAKFMSVHSEELLRVSIDGNTIQQKAEYELMMEGFFGQLNASKQQIDITFAVASTATSGDKVYQTGYYCLGMRASNAEEFVPRGCGYFNVLLIKEDGKWKIALDSDKQAILTQSEFEEAGVVYRLE